MIVGIIGWALFFGLNNLIRNKYMVEVKKETGIFDRELNKGTVDDLEYSLALAKKYSNKMLHILKRRDLFSRSYFSRDDMDHIFYEVLTRFEFIRTNILSEVDDYEMMRDLARRFSTVVKRFHVDLERMIADIGNKDIWYLYSEGKVKSKLKDLLVTTKDLKSTGMRETYLAEKRAERAASMKRKNNEEVYKDISFDFNVGVESAQDEIKVEYEIPVSFEKLNQYINKDLRFIMKNGQKMFNVRVRRVENQTVHADVNIGGGYAGMALRRNEIKRIDKYWVEMNFFVDKEVEPDEAFIRSLVDMPLVSSIQGSDYFGFITKDNRLYFVSVSDGRLMKHSRTDFRRYSPKTIPLQSGWTRNVFVHKSPEEKKIPLKKVDYFAFSPAISGSSFRQIYRIRNGKMVEFELTFQVRMIHRVHKKVVENFIYKEDDVVFKVNNLKMVFNGRSLNSVLSKLGFSKVAKGEKPWEYALR